MDDKIDKSPEMMAILKTGYQLDGKVPKINTNSLRQEFFYTYALKIIIGEKSMSLTDAKGVYDRTFSFTTYAGDSAYDIKETLNPQGNQKCRQRLAEISSFRKLLLIYRLIHFSDSIKDIEVGLKRRNRELCKPVMQLFHDSISEVQSEIKSTLQYFLNSKKHRKGNLIETAYYPLITDLVSQKGRVLPVSDIWDDIVGGKIPGHIDAERKPKEYQTDDYGTIYRNTFTNVICDKFGALKKHTEKGTVLIFNIDKLQKIGKSYDIEANIQLKLEDDPDGSDSSDGSIGTLVSSDESTDEEITVMRAIYSDVTGLQLIHYSN